MVVLSGAIATYNIISNKVKKLQKINRAATVISRSNYDISTGFLLNLIYWDNLITHQKSLRLY